MRKGKGGRTATTLAGLVAVGSLIAVGFFAAPAPAEPTAAENLADLHLTVDTPQLALRAGGEPVTLAFQVANGGPAPAPAPVAHLRIPFADQGVLVQSSNPPCVATSGSPVLACYLPPMTPGQALTVTVVLTPPPAGSLPPTEALHEPAQVWAEDATTKDPNPNNNGALLNVLLTGSPHGMVHVAGRIVDDATALPLTGVRVVIRDRAGSMWYAITDNRGTFAHSAALGAPLTSRRLTIEASRVDYEATRTTVDVDQTGTVSDIQLALSPAASPTPAATGEVTSSPEVVRPIEDIVRPDTARTIPPLALLIIALGGLLALVILGVLAYWFYRTPRADRQRATEWSGSADDPTVVMDLGNLGRRSGDPGPE